MADNGKIFTYIDIDRSIWEKELEEFVPPVVYDMHVHMWSNAHQGTAPRHPLMLEIGHQGHLDWAAKLFPGREMHYLALATPIPEIEISPYFPPPKRDNPSIVKFLSDSFIEPPNARIL